MTSPDRIQTSQVRSAQAARFVPSAGSARAVLSVVVDGLVVVDDDLTDDDADVASAAASPPSEPSESPPPHP
jgi:hypothetical protein